MAESDYHRCLNISLWSKGSVCALIAVQHALFNRKLEAACEEQLRSKDLLSLPVARVACLYSSECGECFSSRSLEDTISLVLVGSLGKSLFCVLHILAWQRAH